MNNFKVNQPLSYRISDWRQLDHCQSNLSNCLHIVTSVIIDSPALSGLVIKVIHDKYGELFVYTLDAKGSFINENVDGTYFQMTPANILAELKKYGFNIQYNPVEHISGNQLQFLMTLENLHYDKIRILNVWSAPLGVKQFKTYVVAFNSQTLGDWLNAGYSPSETEFVNALIAGTACNVSDLSDSQHYDWSWLYNWVGDISDILAENSGSLTR